jgi:hypothetical protein
MPLCLCRRVSDTTMRRCGRIVSSCFLAAADFAAFLDQTTRCNHREGNKSDGRWPNVASPASSHVD